MVKIGPLGLRSGCALLFIGGGKPKLIEDTSDQAQISPLCDLLSTQM